MVHTQITHLPAEERALVDWRFSFVAKENHPVLTPRLQGWHSSCEATANFPGSAETDWDWQQPAAGAALTQRSVAGSLVYGCLVVPEVEATNFND